MASRPLDIAVIGGGMIGSRIVKEAIDRGHDVTLVVRDPSKVAESHERLTVIRGDVLDGSVADRVEGRDVVVSAVGTARAADPDYSLYLEAAQSLVDALRRLGRTGPRLIVVGGFGSLLDSSGQAMLEHVPEDRLPEHLGQKAALGFYRSVADVQWTYLSPPGRISPGGRTGAYRIGADDFLTDENGESGAISMEDYAVAVLDEAEEPRHVGRRFTVAY